MCTSCFVRDFLRNLAVMNQYSFSLTIPCCTCRVPGAFKVGMWSSTTKSPNFHSIAKDIAANGLIVLRTEFAKISAQFYLHRNDLSGIINSSCEDPFSPADQALIQKFCDFIKKYIGHRYSKSHWATEMKFTTRAFRWLSDADVPDVQKELAQLEDYLNQFNGLKQVMLDCAVLCASRMISSQPEGSLVKYKFEDALMLFYDNRAFEQEQAATRVIDLTRDGLYMV